MKKLGIMQPYLFPYLGYFQLMNAVDQYVIYDDVQYIKGGWINRNNILIGKQKVLFTIKLVDASPNKLINQINIQDNFDKFLKTVSMAYSKAPYNMEVMQLLTSICDFKDKNLARFIGNSLRVIAQYVGIDTEFIYSSNLMKDASQQGQDKVISICKEMKADQYYNAIGGTELYDKSVFQQNGIELKFVSPKLREYKQFSNTEFVPGLSIIDVMMFNSPTKVMSLLKDYNLE